jgi:hypothetical protein
MKIEPSHSAFHLSMSIIHAFFGPEDPAFGTREPVELVLHAVYTIDADDDGFTTEVILVDAKTRRITRKGLIAVGRGTNVAPAIESAKRSVWLVQ